uniref:Transcriptional regulator, TetR family n=1 Tax=Caulobacter sp. (strain K31) TaxID=366602 RepID=B0T919_CAUSK
MSRNSERPAAERLVAVATDLFYRKGFRAVGIEEIVDQTGVTKPTLYRNFASKDELGAACLSQLAAQDMARLTAIAERLADEPLGQIRAIVREVSERIADRAYRGWPLSNAEVEIPDRQHPARLVCGQYKTKVRTHLQQLAGQAGLSRPDALADGLLLLIEGAAASWHSFGPDGPSAALSESCETLLAGHAQSRLVA